MTTADEPARSAAGPDGLPPLREVIRSLDITARKSLGQNFILDLNLTRRIARAGGPLQGITVVEIGPGPGGLTRGLLMEGARRVIAIERDQCCLPALEDIARRYPGRLEVHAEDALDVDWRALVVDLPASEVRIAANLPYGIATRLLVGWLETTPWPPWFAGMTLMFQKEVAERIVATPGTKAYGRLAVIAQWRTRCRIDMVLPPDAFTPAPKVASALVDFVPRATLDPLCDVVTLGRVTAAAFGQRRKMLRTSLKAVVADPEAVLERLGLSPELRGERLSVSDFARIAAAIDERAAGGPPGP